MRGLFTPPWVFAAMGVFSQATPRNLEAQTAAAHNLALLIVGLLFPALSWLTGVASYVDWRRHKKHSSPAFVPFAGPIVLTKWVLSAHKPLWVIPLVWLCDLGTIGFFWSLPGLIRAGRQTSPSTRVAVFENSEGMQTTVISIHSTGRYLLERKGRLERKRRPGRFITWEMGELGNVSEDRGTYLLQADHGWSRTLQPAPGGLFQCVEHPTAEKHPHHSLAGWRFQRVEISFTRDLKWHFYSLLAEISQLRMMFEKKFRIGSAQNRSMVGDKRSDN